MLLSGVASQLSAPHRHADASCTPWDPPSLLASPGSLGKPLRVSGIPTASGCGVLQSGHLRGDISERGQERFPQTSPWCRHLPVQWGGALWGSVWQNFLEDKEGASGCNGCPNIPQQLLGVVSPVYSFSKTGAQACAMHDPEKEALAQNLPVPPGRPASAPWSLTASDFPFPAGPPRC